MSSKIYRRTVSPVNQELESVQDLVRKLAQAEAAFHAVVSSEVDAVLDPISRTPIILQEAQKTLWRREKQLSQAEQLAQLGSWTWDIPADRITWSEGLFRIHGLPYREMEFDLRTSFQQIHPDDQEMVRQSLESALQDRKPLSLRYRIIHPDGGVRTLLARTEIFVDPVGNPIQLIGIGLDISERVRTEAEMVSLLDELRSTEKKLRVQNEILKDAQDQLLQERQRYQDLFEFAPDGYLVTDTHGVILEANQAAAGLFDARQDFLTGKPLVAFISPDERRTFQTMLGQVKNNEKVRGWESTIQLPSGMTIPIVLIVASQRDLWGRPLALRWQLHDISERKRAADSLRASQQKLHTIVTSAPILLWAVDRDKTITYFEGKSLSTMGLNGQDFIGRSISEFFGDSPHLFRHIDSALAGEEVVGTLTAGDSILETRYSPLRDSRGAVAGVIGVSIDITAQKQLEADLAELDSRLVQSRENDRLHLSREIHDGPVQDMYGILFHLKAFTDSLPAGINRAPVRIMQASLQQVVDTLRTICRELRPPTLAPFGLEKAIQSHAASFQEANPELALELDLTPDGQELPELLRLTLFRIYQQALTNVVRHANARNVLVHLDFTDEQVTLAIQDDGDGFVLPQKWVEFARSSRLGLIGAIERAEALGGQLLIESALGKGTILRTIIPRQKEYQSSVEDSIL